MARSISASPGQFAGTHLYTWVERGTVRVKCLAQEHKTVSPARARTRTARSGVERTNHEANMPPKNWSTRRKTSRSRVENQLTHPSYNAGTGARFSKVTKSFRTQEVLAKSQNLWLQSRFIHIFLIGTRVPFIQDVSGIYTSPFFRYRCVLRAQKGFRGYRETGRRNRIRFTLVEGERCHHCAIRLLPPTKYAVCSSVSTLRVMYQSNRSFNIPPGQPLGHLNFWKIFGKFPPPEAEKLFKCPIIGPFQVIKCPHPRETFW